ncbi:MAG: hypothetical protein ACYDH9_04365 [Limisphaerales bacterium]
MNHPRILLSIVVLAAILGALILVLTRQTAKSLIYQGKSIEYWFEQLPVTPILPSGVAPAVYQVNVRGFIKSTGQQYGSTNLSDEAIDVIAALGTNALPFLLAKLQGSDSVVKREVTKAARKAGVGYLPFRNADLERLQAVTGLIHVKTLTPEAGQVLTSLRTNTNPEIASAAVQVLTRRDALDDPSRANYDRNAASGRPANLSQPIRADTNRTSSAAGSRR